MPRVNLLKQIKADGGWVLRSIPRKASGGYDWSALPDGRYYIEWYEAGKRRRETAGLTVAQAQEAQRRKRHELEGRKLGVLGYGPPPPEAPGVVPLASAVTQYLEHVETLKKPNTYRKYEAVLRRFSKHFEGRTLDAIPISDLNDYVVHLKRDAGMSANTVLHNTIIIAQFFKRQGRGGITRLLDLRERITTLPKEYRQEGLDKFLKACESFERALFYTFLLTGFREQEVMYLAWSDINLELRTIRVTAKPQLGFYAKRWEEREVPIPLHLVEILEKHPRRESCQFVFPSPTGNCEPHMLDQCKAVAKRADFTATPRKGSYTSWVIQMRCIRITNFRATAMTALCLAFLPRATPTTTPTGAMPNLYRTGRECTGALWVPKRRSSESPALVIPNWGECLPDSRCLGRSPM